MKGGSPSVSVILPTYEERENILELIEGIVEHVGDRLDEIIVVDDDSPDGTWRACEGAKGRFPMLRVIRRTEERGLFTAICTGIEASRGDVVVWMDCDLSMPPDRIPALLDAVERGADLAVGSRYVPGGSDVRDTKLQIVLSRLICGFASVMLERSFKDYTSGFIAMRRSALPAMPTDGDYGEYFIALVYRAFQMGLEVVEVPYALVPRTRGTSKTATSPLGFIVRGRKYLSTILGLRAARV